MYDHSTGNTRKGSNTETNASRWNSNKYVHHQKVVLEKVSTHFCCAGGIPSSNGDYVLSQGDYEFNPVTSLRPCIDLIVFNDQVFEGSEDLSISIQGFILEGSTTVTPSISGVTVDPSSATVTINDNDSEEKSIH